MHVPPALDQLRNDRKSRYKSITKRYGACVLHSLQTFIDRIYGACQAIDNSLSSRQAARFKRQSFYVAIGKISSRSTTRVIFHASLDNYEFRWIVQLLVVKSRRNGDYGSTVYPFPAHTIVLTSFNRTVDCPFSFFFFQREPNPVPRLFRNSMTFDGKWTRSRKDCRFEV